MEGNISHIPVKQDGHNFFMAHVQVSRKGYSVLHNMTGTASILINNKTILHHRRIQRANALHRKVIKSFRKNTQKEYKNLIFLLVED